MTRARAIELLQQIIDAQTRGQSPLEGREMLEATYALGYAMAILRERTTDREFDALVAEMAPWLT